jgi:hypothetical protein
MIGNQMEKKCTDQSSNLQKIIEEKEQRRQQTIAKNKKASIPVLADLAQAGFEVEWVSELHNIGFKYKKAIPILLKWLPIIDNEDVKEAIVRSLSVPWAKPIAAMPLIEEYRKITNGSDSELKWAIANGLSIVADDSVFTEIVELVQDKKNGRSREMLAVSLGNMKNPYAQEVLLELLDDEEVAGHAIMALGKLKSKKARPTIERFLTHKKSWIRQEAKRALVKIDRVDYPNKLKGVE